MQHIACDRTDTSAIQEKLGGKNFDGAHLLPPAPLIDLPEDPTTWPNHSSKSYRARIAAMQISMGTDQSSGAEWGLRSCVRS